MKNQANVEPAECPRVGFFRYAVGMAKTVVTQLTDDIDGSEADETVVFGLDGKTYEIDLSKRNAAALRKALAPYIEHARSAGRATRRRRAPQAARPTSGRRGSTTLFSRLDAEEKERFRAWANMPTARRISDARVQEWIDAGRP